MRFSNHLLAFVAVTMALLGMVTGNGLTMASVVGTILVGLSLLLILRLDPGGASGLAQVFALAVSVRWVTAAIAYLVVNKSQPGLIAPDEIFYDDVAIYYTQYLAGRVPNPYPGSSPGGVVIASAILNYIGGGFVPMAPRFVNAVLGGWTAVMTGLIAGRIGNPAVARSAALLAALTPSLVVWSSINIKDAATLLGAEVALWAFLVMRTEFKLQTLALFVGSLLFVSVNRNYELIFIGLGVMSGFLFQGRRTLRNAGVAVAIGAALLVVLRATNATEMATGEDTMMTIAGLREGYASGAGSAINLRLVDTTTPTGLAVWVPIGLCYFFLAPFPFTGSSLASLLTSPEMIIWYYCLPSAWRGLLLLLRHRFQVFVPVLAYTLVSSIGWSVVITNVGTLYRYRSQVFFAAIICVAVDRVRRSQEANQRRSVLAPELAFVRNLALQRTTPPPHQPAAAPAGR